MKVARIITITPTRRQFLRACGFTGLGLAACSAVPSLAQAAVRQGRAGIAITRTLPLMGTFVAVTAVHESRVLSEEAVGRAFEEMERLIRIFDRHRGDTAVAVLNRDGRLASAPPELNTVVEHSLSFHSLSEGAFDPTVAPIVDALRSRAADGLSLSLTPAELAELLSLVDARQIRCQDGRITLGRQGMAVTLDGIAKGYIADRASEVLSACGVQNHLVNAGGDIRAQGSKGPGQPWTVAIEDPAKGGRYPAAVSLRSSAVATSGSYEAYFDRKRVHHHIVTPTTAGSPQTSVSVSVLAPSAMEADALATAVMVMGPKSGIAFIDSLPCRECLIITLTGAQLRSRGWA